VLGLASPDRSCKALGAGRYASTRLVHPDEGRVVLGAQALGLVCVLGLDRSMPNRRDVVGVVDGEQDLVTGHRGADDLDVWPVEQSEGSAQPCSEVKTHRVHGVVRAEVVARETLIPDHARLCWHNGTVPAGCLRRRLS
jgi:hypothetical protein